MPCNTTGTVSIDAMASEFVPGRSFWVLYNDSADSWGAAHRNASLGCLDKMRAAAHAARVTQYLNRTFTLAPAPQPHVWYLALLACPDSTSPQQQQHVRLAYTVHFKNGGTSEVGADERGLLPLSAACLAAFALLFVVECAVSCALARRGTQHPVVVALALILLAMVLALALVVAHWAAYAHDGTGFHGLRRVGQFVLGIASVLLSTVLLCLASGWSITYHDVPHPEGKIAFALVFAAAYAVLFFAAAAGGGVAAASTQLVCASGALLVFVVLYVVLVWVCGWAYFVWCLVRTWRVETQYAPRRFYAVFGVLASLWFLVPAACNLASLAAPEWRRPLAVDACQLACTLAACTALVAVLWPSRVEEYFRLVRAESLVANNG